MLIEEKSQWPNQSGRKWANTRSSKEQTTSLLPIASLDNSQEFRYLCLHPTLAEDPMACVAPTSVFSAATNDCSASQLGYVSRTPTRRKTTAKAGGGDGGNGGEGQDTKNKFYSSSPCSMRNLAKKRRRCSNSLLVIFVIVLVNLVCSANCSIGNDSIKDRSDNYVQNNYDSPSLTSSTSGPRSANVYSNHFAVHVPAGEQRANEIALKHGFINTGQIGSLKNYYLFEHSRVRKRSVEQSHGHHKLLTDEPDVSWFEQQVEKRRIKRDFQYYDGAHGSSGAGGAFFGSPSSHSYSTPYQNGNGGFPDPLWKEQWYLTGGSKDGFDMNVQVAWKRGYTGKGVTVSILDDGIQTNHPDLILNYDPRASTDINDNDNDPYPQDNGDNKHGTRCAGEVAATAGNNICGVGVAYNASIGGVRMLDGTVNDAVEAKALGLNPDHVDIFSASWGPEDDGKTVDGPGPLARRAFIYGVTNGRRGLGSIFIWASGNGGRHVDSCNCDGYTNSIFTLSISSATQGGYKPWYLEECSSTLATTYSSGTPTLDKSVATVDMDGRLRPDHICTVEHTGTSASAPLAAGIAALALEANPNLSWRDLQHLVVLTSRPDPLEKEEGWYVNGVQRKFSHKFGYGLMDAGKMVDLAVDWAGVPPQHICKSREIREDREIPGSHLGKVKVFMDVDGCAGTNSEIRYLEHVQCKISLRFFPRGNLRILLTSPMGTTSVLLFERPRDVSSSNFDDWPFLSVHYWGEQAHGRWTLEVINSGSRRINQPGMLKKWQLILYGTDGNPVRLKSRSLQLPHPGATGLAPGASVPTGQYHDPGPQTHPSYRAIHTIGRTGESTQLPPRFVPQEYLFSSASEAQESRHIVHSENKKMHSVRSQCQNEFWIKDLAICVNDCPDGYFEDPTARECLSCSQRCKSCYNATSCAACEHNLVLFETECVAKCPERHYEADSSCEQCPVKDCLSCVGPMGQECVQCTNGLYLENGQCVSVCGKGKRPSESNGECVDCSVGCQKCGTQGECMECYPGFQFSADGKLCERVSNCPMGMYLNDEGQCLGCGDLDCLRCQGGQQCLECRDGMILRRGQCVEKCGEGFYQGRENKECFKCASLCTRCTGEGECEECRVDGMLQGGRCLPHCADGYFNDAGTCITCSSACLTCIGPKDSECVTCGSGRRLTRLGTCAPVDQTAGSETMLYANGSCSDGSFFDYNTKECRDCHPSCSRCAGAMAFQCRACRYPLRLDRGSSRCIPCCHDENSEDCCHCDEKRHSASSPYNGECHFVSRRVSESEEREISSGSLSDKVVLMSFWFTVFVLVLAVIVVFQRNKRGKHRRGEVSSSKNFFNSPSSFLGNDDGSDSSALLVNSSSISKINGRSSSSWRHHNSANHSSNVKYIPVNLNDGGDYVEEDDEEDDEEFYNQHFMNQYPNHHHPEESMNETTHRENLKNHYPSHSYNSRSLLDEVNDEDELEFESSLISQQSEGVPLVLKT